MKKLRNHPQSNKQENAPKTVNNETDLCSLTDLEFKREIVKILKGLREDMNSNTLRKELENIRRSQEKLEHSFAEMQTELGAVQTRMNNAEEQISGTEDRIMEITQSSQQTENQIKKLERGVPVVAQWLTNPTRNHEVAGSVPALAQWVNDPALP